MSLQFKSEADLQKWLDDTKLSQKQEKQKKRVMFNSTEKTYNVGTDREQKQKDWPIELIALWLVSAGLIFYLLYRIW